MWVEEGNGGEGRVRRGTGRGRWIGEEVGGWVCAERVRAFARESLCGILNSY